MDDNLTDGQIAEPGQPASAARLAHLVEHAQDLIYSCDQNGCFTYVNPTAARVLQYDQGELLGRHFLTLIRDDHRDDVGERYRQQMRARTPATYLEFPAVTKAGDSIWVGQHVQLVYDGALLVGVDAIARDISRRREIEDRLRTSEARYRALVQGAAYGIYRTTVDGTILDANPALAAMLGYSADELRALNMSSIYRSASARGALIEQYQRELNETLTADVTWQRKDGTPIVVRLTARVAEFEDGLRCFEGVAEDITVTRALEEQLRQAQRMEAVGRLARGVAHDFNNVLAAIIGSSDLLALQLEAAHPAREEAEEIRLAAERGAALTRQLLAFSRSQMIEAKLLDLDEVVAGLEHLLQRLAGERIPVSIRVSGSATLVRIEPGQLEQLLMNLVVNARDAMPGGGSVHVLVEPIDLDERAVLRYPGLSAGRFARIAVTDSGEGIDPDLQPHIFEPSFATKGSVKGTGLGLSIVYGIAKEAGGIVSFFTSRHEGTTFEVLLPLVTST
jgi:PAS domain S-box-containing protein